jgi:hypothetical protein
MLKFPSQRFTPIFLACLSSVVGVSIAGISFWRGPMYGDDYLTTAYFYNIDNDFFGSIFSNERWRPLNNLFLYFTTHYFGFDYLPYLMINRILLVLCGVVSGLLAYSLSKSLLAVVLVSLAVSISHLTYMGQISVFGFLELGSTIFLITAIHAALLSIEAQTISEARAEFLQIISAVLLLSACLTHERFQIASLSFWILFRLKGANFNKLKSRSILFLLIPGFISIFKLLSSAKVLQGGGEANFITSFGQAIINNFGFSILGVFGYFSGIGHYSDPSVLAVYGQGVDLNLLGFLIHLFPLLLLIGLGLYHLIKYQCLPKFFDYKSWFLISLAFCFLLIGSTIVSRIEGRWLFQSTILIAIIIYSALGNLKITTLAKQSLFHLQILPFLLISSVYNLDSSNFTVRRDQTSLVVLELERISAKFIDWRLAINHSGKPIARSWEFAYGRVFTQLINGPELVSDCSNIPNCVTVDIWDARLDFKIRKAQIDNRG